MFSSTSKSKYTFIYFFWDIFVLSCPFTSICQILISYYRSWNGTIFIFI